MEIPAFTKPADKKDGLEMNYRRVNIKDPQPGYGSGLKMPHGVKSRRLTVTELPFAATDFICLSISGSIWPHTVSKIVRRVELSMKRLEL